MKTPRHLLIILLFLSLNVYSQEVHHHHHETPEYVPLEDYNKTYVTPLKKRDSLNFIIRDNDTLVLLRKKMKIKGTFVPYVYKDSVFLNYYTKVAFNHKNDSISMETPMKYWKKDIKLFFAKSVSKREKKEILSFAKEISKNVDSLSIYEAKNFKDSNYIVYFSEDYNYDPNLTNVKLGEYWIYWNNNNQLTRCALKINNERLFSESLRIDKIKALFFQSLGYFKLSKEFDCKSYFSNCASKDKTITDFDMELLKYHYCYGICKGTPLETFLIQHEEAKEISKDHHYWLRFYYPNY